MIWFGVLAVLTSKVLGDTHEAFSENMELNWLPNGDYHAVFNFDFLFEPSPVDHFDRFPKVVHDFMKDNWVNEFHLSLTQGMWRYKQFGYPKSGANPSGAELWIWFQNGSKDVNNQWDLAVNSLAGFFCASLNFMSTSFSGSPSKVLRPNSQFHSSLNSSEMKYSNLPSENVCTENLTPWKKLLPCELSSGFVQLLNANQLFNSKYMSLDLNAYRTCDVSDPQCGKVFTKMTLSANVVFDGYRFRDESRTLSLLTLFHKPLGRVCPLADSTSIKTRSFKPNCSFQVVSNEQSVRTNVLLLSSEDRITDVQFERKCAQSQNKDNQIDLSEKDKSETKSPVLVHKYLSSTTGGEEKIVCQISNELEEDVLVSYLDLVPWHFRLLAHSLQLTDTDNRVITPTFFNYIPSQDRERPSTLQLEFTIPRNAKVEVSVKIRKVLLKWTEHPPDPHHGHSCGPSLVYVDVANRSFRVYSEPLLIQLMVPDFSMPYNVLCLSSTIMTIGYSAAQTLSTKRYSFVVHKTLKQTLILKLQKIKAKVVAIFTRSKKVNKVD